MPSTYPRASPAGHPGHPACGVCGLGLGWVRRGGWAARCGHWLVAGVGVGRGGCLVRSEVGRKVLVGGV